MTSHLADKVDFIYADRTFSNFEVLPNRKFFSSIAKYLFKLSSGGWMINNELSLVHKGNQTCHKVILVEKADEVVEVHSSLMTGVAREVLGRKKMRAGQEFYLSRKQLEMFISAT